MRNSASAIVLAIIALLFVAPADAASPGAVERPVAQRFDPYKSYRYLLIWNGHAVAGFQRISSLGGSTEVHANDSARTKYDSITLERGVTYDMDFANWAAQVWQAGNKPGSEVSLANFRKDMYLEYYNETGEIVVTYKLTRCWISQYNALPNLDASANAVAIEHIRIENEGFARELPVSKP